MYLSQADTDYKSSLSPPEGLNYPPYGYLLAYNLTKVITSEFKVCEPTWAPDDNNTNLIRVLAIINGRYVLAKQTIVS